MLSRRHFLASSFAAAASQPFCSTVRGDEPIAPAERAIAHVPQTQLTTGPHFHWFGYYDKEQFSPNGSQVLTNQVDFEGRSPRPDDTIRVGLVPADGTGGFTELGRSSAWGWQQGCMLQWVPGTGASQPEVIWNDRIGLDEDARFVSRIARVQRAAPAVGQEAEATASEAGSGPLRTLPHPIYALAPDGSFGVTTDFERIQNMRPGYGYAGVVDPNEEARAPENAGITRVDLATGDAKLLVSYAEMAAIPHRGESLTDKWHYFNHLLVDPVGERMIFLHRWRDQPRRRGGVDVENAGGFKTRLVTCRCDDGSDRFLLDPSGATSHFIWRDPEHICAWTYALGENGFYLFRDRTREVLPVGAHVMTVNGHNTYVPGTAGQWILNDTYPDKRTRLQTVYLYHVPSNVRYDLAQFYSPPRYTGEVRTDLHPRTSRDGRSVVVDSPHTGGRQLHRLEISEIIAKAS